MANCAPHAGVGSLVGAWLVAQGGRLQVQLLGRSGRAAASPLMADVQRGAAYVTMARCDVACAEEAAAVLLQEGPLLTGVVHAGGVLADAMIPNQTAAAVRSVFAPKVCLQKGCPSTIHHESLTTRLVPVIIVIKSFGGLLRTVRKIWTTSSI